MSDSELISALKKRIELTNFDANMSGRDAMFVKGITIQAANERLQPVLLAMVEIVRLSEMVIAEVHAQKVIWPGEVDALEDGIARLKEAVSGEDK